MSITLANAKELVIDVMKAGLVSNLISSPGIGKSSLVRQIADEFKLKVIDVRLSSADPTDLNGFPMVLQNTLDKAAQKAGYIPMDTFPIEGDEVPEGYKGWIILLDEFPSAPLAVQAAAYKLVLDKMVGLHNLHKKVAIIAAGNKSTDKAIVNRLSTAMQSRMVHFEIDVCNKAFDTYAEEQGFDYRVRSFLKFRPALLHKFDPNHSDHTFPCPRTWEFVSKLVKNMPTIPYNKLPLLVGTVGKGAGTEFQAFSEICANLPTLSTILANPETVSIGDDPSVHYALTGLIGENITIDNADKLIAFISRLGIDFQVITMRSALRKNRAIKDTKAARAWIIKNSEELR